MRDAVDSIDLHRGASAPRCGPTSSAPRTSWSTPPTTRTSRPRRWASPSATWKEAEGKLAGGGKVLFVPGKKDLGVEDPGVSATPIFWNRLMNPKSDRVFWGCGAMPKNPALAGFPTEDHCDWQWVDVMRGAKGMNLDHLPRGLQPIVQGIDDWNRGYKLGLIYECKVGRGKLMVCSVDLSAERAAGKVTAGALRKSLLAYMGSEQFAPGGGGCGGGFAGGVGEHADGEAGGGGDTESAAGTRRWMRRRRGLRRGGGEMA